MDLFEYMHDKNLKKESPLAARLRPESLEDVVGQKHIIAKDKLLYRAIKADKISSLIFYGPSGTGKTSIAKIIANTTQSEFMQLNATTSGKKNIEEVIEKAKISLGMYYKKTILFIDEIHRFNKAQQDFLLPFVEDGTIILIGATTENPYFEVNSALISRSLIFELKPLEKEDIKILIKRAVENKEKGMGSYNAVINDAATEFLADISNGDARTALNAIEIAVLTTQKDNNGIINLDEKIIEDCVQKRVLKYDKNGDSHYDIISAFIKSMRGSDPDAAVYYLARMLESGESVTFIARRIIICASEDVGLADPNALTVAVSAANAVHQIGMPEARIPLAQAAIYIACAPKSNSAYIAINKAMDSVRNISVETIPKHLKDGHYKGAKNLGNGIGYLYSHDYENHFVEQQYLPEELKDEKFYFPTEIGYEAKVKEYFKKIGKQGDLF